MTSLISGKSERWANQSISRLANIDFPLQTNDDTLPVSSYLVHVSPALYVLIEIVFTPANLDKYYQSYSNFFIAVSSQFCSSELGIAKFK